MSLVNAAEEPLITICATVLLDTEVGQREAFVTRIRQSCLEHAQNQFDARVAVVSNQNQLELLQLLEEAGFSDLVDLRDSRSPLQTVRSLTPDLVVLHCRPEVFRRQIDWYAPPTALDILSALSADPSLCDIPTIALTREGDLDSQRRAVRFGANEISLLSA